MLRKIPGHARGAGEEIHPESALFSNEKESIKVAEAISQDLTTCSENRERAVT